MPINKQAFFSTANFCDRYQALPLANKNTKCSENRQPVRHTRRWADKSVINSIIFIYLCRYRRLLNLMFQLGPYLSFRYEMNDDITPSSKHQFGPLWSHHKKAKVGHTLASNRWNRMHANRQCLVKAMSACSMDTERLPPSNFTIPTLNGPVPRRWTFRLA